MADRDLFEDVEQNETPKQDPALLKKYQDLESKLSGLQEEYNKSTQSWQAERAQLEENLKGITAKATSAENWDRLINENPMAAAKMIMDFTLGRSTQGVVRGGNREEPQQQTNEEIKQVLKKQEEIEKYLQNKAAQEYINNMYEAISGAMEEVHEVAGIEANPKAIIEYLQRNNYQAPSQVKDAVYGMYRDQILASTKKQKDKDDTVVMGTSGYPSGEMITEEKVVSADREDMNDLWNKVATNLFK